MLTKIITKSEQETRTVFVKKVCAKITRYERKILKDKKMVCQHCGSITQYVKRGSRERKIRTSYGDVQIRVQQVCCRSCLKVSRPILKHLGLDPKQVLTEELLDKTLNLAINTSYAVSRKITNDFTQQSVSAGSIRRYLLKASEKIKIDQESQAPKDYRVILKDATKGNTGKTKRGEDIYIAYAISGRKFIIDKQTGKYIPVGLIGDIIQVSVGTDTFENIQHTTSAILTDGDRSIKNKAQALMKKQNTEIELYRCHWHLPRMLGFALYNDGYKNKQQRLPFTCKLNSIIHHSHTNFEQYYDELIDELQSLNLNKSIVYLKNAREEFLRGKKNPIMIDGIPLIANSPVERVMREVKRRSRIGARWSAQGLEAITRLRLHTLYNCR